ncbi:chaperonin 10-like protein [Thelonectria olida]|uniref:alcohol dehydrogenase n=1 Tax=Thelonectria olida TaxID=1576542 RepID=A0A9P8W9M8_9HYPO|nr:chaperonin 10-like protein [Thelonectria olida]
MAEFEIPTEQWAQVIEETGVTTYKQVPVQQPGPDEVLVNVKYSGVCHTDLHALMGDWPLERKTPVIGGHEGAGVVVAKGKYVSDIEIGDHVGIKWLNSSCLECSFCIQSLEPLCNRAQLSGYTVDGSFQQYAVANAAHVARIPKECDLAAVAPILCAGLTVYKGLKASGARAGQSVAIVGAGGGLGNLAIQYAKAMGLHPIAIDGGEEKGEACLKLGATTYIDFMTTKNIIADVKAATSEGLGPHAVLLLAASDRPFQQAIQYVRSAGTIVCIGMPAGGNYQVPVFDAVVRCINVVGSYVGNRQDTQEAIDFFARGMVRAPFKVAQLDELQSVFDMMKENKIVGRYVLKVGD